MLDRGLNQANAGRTEQVVDNQRHSKKHNRRNGDQHFPKLRGATEAGKMRQPKHHGNPSERPQNSVGDCSAIGLSNRKRLDITKVEATIILGIAIRIDQQQMVLCFPEADPGGHCD